MRIDIWSDIVCPFCMIGKRHLELALADFPHRDQVEIEWHSFELDPSIEAVSEQSLVDKIAGKYGMSRDQSERSQRDVAAQAAAVGLEFNWQSAKFGNTFHAHRLVHLAADHGLAGAAEDTLMKAYFTDGEAIGDIAVLQRLGESIGLPSERVRAVLGSDEYAEAVRRDERNAHALGANAVPFFVFDSKYGISGAQPVEVFSKALQQVWDEQSEAAVKSVG